MISNEEILKESRQILSGKWSLAIGGNVIFALTVIAAGFIPLGSLVVSGPLTLGLVIFSMNIAENKEFKIDNIFEGFDQFKNTFIANILLVVFILFWTLLFIIPGIIAAIAYSQTFYIIKENPNLSAYDAILKSKSMMDGYKMQYFVLMLFFALASFVCVLTLGIGFLWLFPFMNVTKANFYKALRKGIIIDN